MGYRASMFEEILPPLALAATAGELPEPPDQSQELRRLLLGESVARHELPPLADLVAGAIALAQGARPKVLLPLGRTPAEFALVRRGSELSIDCYSSEATPEILLPERTIALQALLDACGRACLSAAGAAVSGTTSRALRKLAGRVERTRIQSERHRTRWVRCTGGSLTSPGAHVPLCFGFQAQIPGSLHDELQPHHAFADVHALLFEGELWAFSGERRVVLARGPILLAAQRMLAAVRSLVDAWQLERPLHVRLCAGQFQVTVRRDSHGAIAFSTSSERGAPLTWPALEIESACLPVLRLVSDLIRKLVGVDRAQNKNLRVAALRNELRALRRIIRGRSRRSGFENRDPERLRLSTPDPLPPEPSPEPSLFRSGRLRYSERWSVEIEALDAQSIFLCGERLILATPKLTFALARSSGEVEWSLPSARARTLLLGRSLLRLLPDGGAELLDIAEGLPYAQCEPGLRLHGSPFALFAGGGDLPPVAILCEAGKHLIALDLRTGAPRWRSRGRGHSAPRVQRAGRVLLVTSDEGAIDALDVASGEVVWRFSDAARFATAPAIWGDRVVAASGEPGNAGGQLHAIDLYTGKALWKRELPLAPSGAPIATRDALLVPTGGSREALLCAFEPQRGSARWTCHDPGFDNGGKALEVDDTLIVNTPSGRVSALELATGATRWSRALADPLTDDVPRQLEPVLRHGALFVPAAQVHVLRPSDGASLTTETGCDLVPDFLRVDERAWYYVAEESGHLRAYASAPQLTLVHSKP
jgi:outer membrane protein assembly factor BamB